MLTGAATVLTVRAIADSMAYYRDALGFAVTFQYGEPVFYVCLCRDEVNVHLISAKQTQRLPGNGSMCLFVRDVDALHVEFVQRGAKVVKPPQNYDYGMREFKLVDLDGNELFVGMSLHDAEPKA